MNNIEFDDAVDILEEYSGEGTPFENQINKALEYADNDNPLTEMENQFVIATANRLRKYQRDQDEIQKRESARAEMQMNLQKKRDEQKERERIDRELRMQREENERKEWDRQVQEKQRLQRERRERDERTRREHFELHGHYNNAFVAAFLGV